MQVTALCVTLWIDVSLLTIHRLSYAQSSDAAVFPRIIPSRLQLFEYEHVSFACEGFGGSAAVRVMRKISAGQTTCASTYETSAGSCTIKNAFQEESGEYWCEAAGGDRSNTVNIIVTGSVILESPVRPVTEGNNVTLRCRCKATPDLAADFYKDGVLVGNGSTGEATVCNVSKSDEGLYRCSIPGCGESAESFMAVAAPGEETSRHHPLPRHYILLGSFVVALFVVLLPLLLVRRFCRRRQKVSGQDGAAGPHIETYAVVRRATQREPAAPSAGFSQHLNNDDHFYATIERVAES